MSPRKRTEAFLSEASRKLERCAFQEAITLYDEALSAAKETGDAACVDSVYACRAAAAAEAGPANEELVELERILLRRRKAATACRAAATVARIYEIRGERSRAARYARRARARAAGMRQALLTFDTEALCGRLLMADSRFEAAEECYRRALEAIADRAEVAPVRRAHVQDELGYCLMVRGRTDDGLRLVHAGLQRLEARGLLSQAAPLLLDLCYGYLQSGRYGAARYFGELYLECVVPEDQDGAGRTVLYLVAEACRLDGSDEEARRWLDRLAGLYPGFRMLRACLDAFDFRRVIHLKC